MNDDSNRHYLSQHSLFSTQNLDITMEITSTGLLSQQSFMKMETKFITHLNAKYLNGTHIHTVQQATIPSSPKPPVSKIKEEKTKNHEKIVQMFFEEKKENEVKNENKEKPLNQKRNEKEEIHDHKIKKPKKHHNDLKIDIGKNNKNVEAIVSPRKKHAKEDEKPSPLRRSNTMSPTKSSIKPRYSDESSTKKKFRVKFNKKDQVFKVENFKDELKKIKLLSDY